MVTTKKHFETNILFMKLNDPKVDSLRLLIPFDEITVNPNHSTFTRTITSINEDGEIIDQKTNNTFRLHTNPCSSTYLKAVSIINGNAVEVLKIGFSSKTLKHKYFEGITKENINDIYDFIISENVVSFNKESLINARVVDTDICYDLMLKDSNVIDVIKIARELSVPHKRTNINAFTQENNVGIEWGERNKVFKAYKTKQYLKYYAKSLELKHNSTLFYDSYIKSNKEITKYLIDNKLLRIETTLKNNAHWNTYGATVITLRDLLELDLTKLSDVFKRPISHYMKGDKFIPIKTNLNVTERQSLMLLKLTMDYYNMTEFEAIEHLSLTLEPNPKNRGRFRKKLQYKKNFI